MLTRDSLASKVTIIEESARIMVKSVIPTSSRCGTREAVVPTSSIARMLSFELFRGCVLLSSPFRYCYKTVFARLP